MASKPLIYRIYEDMSAVLLTVTSKVYLGRPKTTDSNLSEFLVFEIPTELLGMIAGNADVRSDCYPLISVYVNAKSNGTLNIGAQSNLIQKVLDLFPINGKHIVAKKPRILMRGNDDTGYQVTQITFKLRTKFNARTIE